MKALLISVLLGLGDSGLMEAAVAAEGVSFLPTNTVSGERLEFRGWVVEGEARIFNIYDAITGRSLWLGLNQPSGSLAVRAYDHATESIVVETGAGLFSLGLKRTKIGLSLSVSPNLPAAPTGVDTPVPAAALEREIRRRRALQELVMELVAAETDDGASEGKTP